MCVFQFVEHVNFNLWVVFVDFIIGCEFQFSAILQQFQDQFDYKITIFNLWNPTLSKQSNKCWSKTLCESKTLFICERAYFIKIESLSVFVFFAIYNLFFSLSFVLVHSSLALLFRSTIVCHSKVNEINSIPFIYFRLMVDLIHFLRKYRIFDFP